MGQGGRGGRRVYFVQKKCDMNKCDPIYCEGLTRGHIFWCHTFLSKIYFNFIGGWPGWSVGLGWSGDTGWYG